MGMDDTGIFYTSFREHLWQSNVKDPIFIPCRRSLCQCVQYPYCTKIERGHFWPLWSQRDRHVKRASKKFQGGFVVGKLGTDNTMYPRADRTWSWEGDAMHITWSEAMEVWGVEVSRSSLNKDNVLSSMRVQHGHWESRFSRQHTMTMVLFCCLLAI